MTFGPSLTPSILEDLRRQWVLAEGDVARARIVADEAKRQYEEALADEREGAAMELLARKDAEDQERQRRTAAVLAAGERIALQKWLAASQPTPPRERSTHCTRGHELTPANTYVFPDGKKRRCRTCLQQWSRDYRREARAMGLGR